MKKAQDKNVCIIECGNRKDDTAFNDKISLLNQFIEEGNLTQISENMLLYKVGSHEIDIILIHGKSEAEAINKFIDNKKHIILHGSCCSLLPHVSVGSIILPSIVIDNSSQLIKIDSSFLDFSESLASENNLMICDGKIGQVDRFVNCQSGLSKYQMKYFEFFDQETLSIAKTCLKLGNKFIAILYVSDNLTLQLTKHIVDQDPQLKHIKIKAKKKSFLFSISVAIKLQNNYDRQSSN